MRSTQGMNQEKKIAQWVLVADRHRIVLFEQTTHGEENTFALKKEYLNPEGRSNGLEIESDRPGRKMQRQTNASKKVQMGKSRHSFEGTPDEHARQVLVKQAATIIESKDFSLRKTKLTVVADPKLLGLLRPVLRKSAPKSEISFKKKDFAWISKTQLSKRLEKLVA